MPESALFPGCYWTTNRSPDRTELLARADLAEGDPDRLLYCMGHALIRGNLKPITVFVPEGNHPGPIGTLMSQEIGGPFSPGPVNG